MGEQLRREQLQPEGEVEHPGMLSPVCFNLDVADLSRAGPKAPGP